MKRLLGVDLLRLYSFLFICNYHFSTMLWEHDSIRFEQFRRLDPYFIFYFGIQECFWYSGWVVIAISALLLGIRSGDGKPISNKLIAALFVAWPLMCFAYYGFGNFDLYWDVYPYLAVSFLACNLVYYLKLSSIRLKYLFLIIAALLILTQGTAFTALDTGFWGSVIWGGCFNNESGFPLVPFSFFILLFFILGNLYVKNELSWLKHPKYPKAEVCIWSAILLCSLKYYGESSWMIHLSYLQEECLSVEFSPLIFWSAFVWPLAFLRVSLIEKFNLLLAQKIKFVSKLYINKSFGMSYFASFLLMGTVARLFSDVIKDHTYLYILATLLLYPSIELFMYCISKIMERFKLRSS